MRTFHIGGTATRRVEQSTLETRHGGQVKFLNLNVVKNREGSKTVMNRNGEMAILDEGGRERERYMVSYGAKLNVKEGDKISGGKILAEWDPYTIPMLTEIGGKVEFADIVEGNTMKEQLDPVTAFGS